MRHDCADTRLHQPSVRRLLAGLPLDELRALHASVRRNRTGLVREILAHGSLPADRVYEAVAQDMGLPYVETPLDPDRLILDDRFSRTALRRSVPVFYRNDGEELAIVIAPDVFRFEAMKRYLARYPAIAGRMIVTGSANLRKALLRRLSDTTADRASAHLMRDAPAMSARHGLSGWQGAAIAALAIMLPLGLALAASATLTAMHVLATVFFLSCVALRLLALAAAVRPDAAPCEEQDRAGLPVYTVLVACYREAHMAPQIVAAMKALRWPASRLEVKLVCEADDLATIEAFHAEDLPANFEVLEVPVRGPRTKPKALDFALRCSSGDIVAVFDAEDRPHPDQLLEAWRALEAGGDDLACVQAPLDITNGGQGWLARMFQLEYAALFRGVLPWLASHGRVLLLGGTSNHFRRTVLEEIGAWDPYNVTEDADLAVRLARQGYRCGIIANPTREEAPSRLREWLPQRTRWFKGWMQTWLVHMRHPRRARADLGRRDFWMMQVLLAGTIGSALIHPLMLGFVAWTLATSLQPPGSGALAFTLASVDVANVVLAYAVFYALAVQASPGGGFFRRIADFISLPAYWMLHSVAAWRAAWQLYRDPFRWEKTPHTPVST